MAAAGKIKIGRLLYKLPLLLAIVACYALLAALAHLLWHKQRGRRLRTIVAINSFLGKTALRLLNMQVQTDGDVPTARNFLIVSNHMSYIDPLVLFNAFRGVFVTSVEVRENKTLGPLCRLSECYFVERRNKFNIKQEIADIGQYLRLGCNVVFFPEGTSTNGEQILRFKSSFFQIAVNENATILPVCLQYLQIDGEDVTPANRDSLYWYGNMGFFEHLVLILSLRQVKARITILPELPVAGRDKNTLAGIAQQHIEDFYFAKH